MTVMDLIEKLNSMVVNGICEEDTELLLFAECIPGTAHNEDILEVSMNGNMVQLFMKYE